MAHSLQRGSYVENLQCVGTSSLQYWLPLWFSYRISQAILLRYVIIAPLWIIGRSQVPTSHYVFLKSASNQLILGGGMKAKWSMGRHTPMTAKVRSRGKRETFVWPMWQSTFYILVLGYKWYYLLLVWIQFILTPAFSVILFSYDF